jgi:hypothetical protein
MRPSPLGRREVDKQTRFRGQAISPNPAYSLDDLDGRPPPCGRLAFGPSAYGSTWRLRSPYVRARISPLVLGFCRKARERRR